MTKYTQIDAVLDALDTVGDLTSLNVLCEKATQLYGGLVQRAVACNVRKAWREANNLQHDCRTYATQPRRNMLKDDFVSLENQLAATKLLDNVLSDTSEFLKCITSFHSLDHMVHCIKKAKSKRKRKVA